MISNICRRKKGVVTLFFILVMLPVLFTSIFLTSDYGNIILAHRQAADVADSVVSSAVSSYKLDSDGNPTGNLDQNLAKNNANDVFNKSTSLGVISSKYNPSLDQNIIFSNSDKEVTITIYFSIKPILTNIIGRIASPTERIYGSVTRSAVLCNSELNESCANPL